MALTTDMIFTQPVCYELKNISVPTVLIIGKLDRTAIGKERVSAATAATLGNYPLLAQKTAGQIKNSKVFELEGIGHIPHVENFQLFKDNLDKALKN